MSPYCRAVGVFAISILMGFANYAFAETGHNQEISADNATMSVLTPVIVSELASGPVDTRIQHALLLLSEEERVSLRDQLRRVMTEDEIQIRHDLFEIVGPPEDQMTSVEELNALGREEMLRQGSEPTLDGWQIYVEVPFYSQQDPHWGWYGLGFAKCSDSYIWRYGCHLTCISMLYAKWGFPEMYPLGLNNWSVPNRAHNAFSTDKCGDLIRLPEALQYGACRPWRNLNASEVYGQLQNGRPVIANTDWGGNHFVVIFGFDGSRYWVKDPWQNGTNQNQPLTGNIKSYRLYGYN